MATYTRVEYIETTGTQYFDTGYNPTTRTKILSTCYFPQGDTSPTDNAQVLCGADTPAFYFLPLFSGTSGVLKSNDIGNNLNGPTINSSFCNTKFTIEYNSYNRLSQNPYGVGVANVSQHDSANISRYLNDGTSVGFNLYIFASNSSSDLQTSTAKRFAKTGTKIYSFAIYEDNVLQRYYVPVLDEDSRPCLYDLLNMWYIYPQGTGNVLYGNEICTTEENYSGQLQYIEAIDFITPYVETGIYCSYGKIEGQTKILPRLSYYPGKPYEIFTTGPGLVYSSSGWTNGHGYVGTVYETATTTDSICAYSDRSGGMCSEAYSITINDTILQSGQFNQWEKSYIVQYFGANQLVVANMMGRIYYIKVLQDDVAVIDLLPWRDGNGIACFKDKVSGNVFYATDGQYIGGPKAQQPTSIVFKPDDRFNSMRTGFTLGVANGSSNDRFSIMR